MVIENQDDRDFIADLYESKRKLWLKKAYALTQDMHTAEDMVSEAFIKLIDKIELLRSLDCYKVTAYVVITIENTCRTYLSRNSRIASNTDSLGEDIIEKVKSDFSTEQTVLDRLDLEETIAAIKKLDSVERDFLIKYYFEGLDDKEIAKKTGMKYTAVRIYRFRLISKIRKICKSERNEKIHE